MDKLFNTQLPVELIHLDLQLLMFPQLPKMEVFHLLLNQQSQLATEEQLRMFLELPVTANQFHTLYCQLQAHLMSHPHLPIAAEVLHTPTHMLLHPMDMRQLPMSQNKAQMDNGSPMLMSQLQVEEAHHTLKLHQHTKPNMEVLLQLFQRPHNMEELKPLLKKPQLIAVALLQLFQLKLHQRDVLKLPLQELPLTQMEAQSLMLILLLQTVKPKLLLTHQSQHQMVELLPWLQEQPLMARVSQTQLLPYHHQHLPQL
jgi:hypothetical protein